MWTWPVRKLQWPSQARVDGDLARVQGGVMAMGRTWTQELLRMRTYEYAHLQMALEVFTGKEQHESCVNKALTERSGFNVTAFGVEKTGFNFQLSHF